MVARSPNGSSDSHRSKVDLESVVDWIVFEHVVEQAGAGGGHVMLADESKSRLKRVGGGATMSKLEGGA